MSEIHAYGARNVDLMFFFCRVILFAVHAAAAVAAAAAAKYVVFRSASRCGTRDSFSALTPLVQWKAFFEKTMFDRVTYRQASFVFVVCFSFLSSWVRSSALISRVASSLFYLVFLLSDHVCCAFLDIFVSAGCAHAMSGSV